MRPENNDTSGFGAHVQGSGPKSSERAPRPQGNSTHSQSRALPFDLVRDRALPQMEAICRAWLPNGRRQGGWWVANVPWRQDSKASLGVSFATGRWRDFANIEERGDVIDLACRVFGFTPREAVEKLAAMLGVNC